MSDKSVKLIPHDTINVLNSTDNIPTGVSLIGAPGFWIHEPTKGANVKIAVLDTGCDVNHPDLAGRIAGVRNFTSEDNGRKYLVTDYNGHGTHVAGTIAANENSSGVVGVAPNARLYILKVLTNHGGTIDWLISAIKYAMFLNVDIITMSLGTSYNDYRLHNIIKQAVAQNISVVCAAGNEGDSSASTNEYSYPAAYPESICVGSIGSTLQASSFTNSNDQIDVVALGESVTSTYPNNLYAIMSGTSQATPHVTGALALLKNWSKVKFGRTLSEQEIFMQLVKKSIDLGLDYKLTGHGMIYLTIDDVVIASITN